MFESGRLSEMGGGEDKGSHATTSLLGNLFVSSNAEPEQGIQCRDGCIYAICDPTGEREDGCLTRNMTSLGILRICFEKESAGRASVGDNDNDNDNAGSTSGDR